MAQVYPIKKGSQELWIKNIPVPTEPEVLGGNYFLAYAMPTGM
jgi:hypothetical protein